MIRVAILAALALAGCQKRNMEAAPAPPPNPNAPPSRLIQTPAANVMKFCDHGRAVYVAYGSYERALAIAPAAEECSHTAVR